MSDRLAVFNDGRVEQVGAPGDVYERPASEFIAGFVGVSNVIERDGRRFTVRPEKVRFADGDGDGLRTERGTVTDVAYLGMITRFTVELEGGGTLQLIRQNLDSGSAAAHAETGRAVTVGWRPEHEYVIHQEER